jgi:hypothetical protein
MRLPAVQNRKSHADWQQLDAQAIGVIGAALLLGGMVWVLAIAKLIELCRFH